MWDMSGVEEKRSGGSKGYVGGRWQWVVHGGLCGQRFRDLLNRWGMAEFDLLKNDNTQRGNIAGGP